MEKLRPLYEDHGISIPEDIDNVQMLPEMRVPKAPVAKSLLLAWRRLYRVDKALWLTIGLARCAGLRRDEIEHITRAWIVADKSGAVVIDVRDRPEESYAHKTGEAYRAVVLCKRLARELVACEKGLIVRPNLKPGLRKISRHRWFERYPQAWLKPFTGNARQPLHRLRGLYADDVRRRTEALLLAQQAAKKEASRNLGHTGTKTAEKHYFSER